MKKKIVSVLLCMAMITTATVGCGKKESNDSAAGGETIKLKVWAAEEDQDLTKELISKFEEENKDQKFDITVGVESESTAKDGSSYWYLCIYRVCDHYIICL